MKHSLRDLTRPIVAIGSPRARSVISAVSVALAASTTAAAQATGRPASLVSRAAPAAFADSARLSKLHAAFPDIDRLVREFAQRQNVPGYGYGIIIDGKLAHIAVGGVRNTESKAPVDTGTVFRIASMSKSFAAAAILQLRDARKLSLDDPAARYVPELAQLRYPTDDSPRITIRDLLTHSAGFPEDNPWGDQQLAVTDAQMSALMRQGIPFSTAPGTAYEYSNFGFAILGRIVANVSGMPYPRYLRERILLPLGMTSTTLEARTVSAQRLALGYRLQDGKWLEEPQLPDGAFGPMGGMLTSIADLSKWVGFMLDAWPARDGADNAPLSRASRREMQQIWRYNGASAVSNTSGALTLTAGGYGYGLGIRQNCDFRTSVAHTGGLPGFGSIMRWLPEHGVGIVALGSLTYTGWTPIVDQAYDILVRTGGLAPRVPVAAPVLRTRQAQVTRLVLRWDDQLADSLAAMNLFLDESKPRRRAAIEKLRADVGESCQPHGDIVPLNALRGSWRLRCQNGDLRVTITLAPTEPAGVQHLQVSRISREQSLDPPAVCRQ